jgi:hypothetical protein
VEKQQRGCPSCPSGKAAYAQSVYPCPRRLYCRANLANHRDPIVGYGSAAKLGCLGTMIYYINRDHT